MVGANNKNDPKISIMVTDSSSGQLKIFDQLRVMLKKTGQDLTCLNFIHTAGDSRVAMESHLNIYLGDEKSKPKTNELTRRAYKELCGLDIDFSKICMKDDWQAGWPEQPECLNPESLQMRRLRGAAWRLEDLLSLVKPAGIYIPKTASALSLITLSKAIKLGIPAFFIDADFCPGHLHIEALGPYFFKSDPRAGDWEQSKPGPNSALKIRECFLGSTMISDGRPTGGQAKYESSKRRAKSLPPTQSNASHLPFQRKLTDFHDKFSGRIIYLPSLLSDDVEGFAYLRDRGLRSWENLYCRVIRHLPNEIGLVLDRNAAIESGLADMISSQRNILILDDSLGITDILSSVSALASCRASHLLAAAIHDLPALSLAPSLCSGHGFTLDWDEQADLADYLTGILKFRPENQMVFKFLSSLVGTSLFSVNSHLSTLHRSVRSESGQILWRDPTAPFWQEGRGPFADYYHLREEYSRLAYKNYTHPEIMAKLGRRVVDSEAAAPTINNEWLRRAGSVATPNLDYLAPYAWAANVLPDSDSVLVVGCGNGYGPQFLALRTDIEVLAFDQERELVEHASSCYPAPNLSFETQSAGSIVNSIAWDERDSFDLIMVCDQLDRLLEPSLFMVKLREKMTEQSVLIGRVSLNAINNSGKCNVEETRSDLSALSSYLGQENAPITLYYQNSIGLSREPGPGDHSLIFVLSHAPEKIETLDELVPFIYDSAQSAIIIFVPPSRFYTRDRGPSPEVEAIDLVCGANKSEVIFYGPYITLDAGEWDIELLFEAAPGTPDLADRLEPAIFLDIISQGGQEIYFQRELSPAALLDMPKIRIRLDSRQERLEVRAYYIETEAESEGVVLYRLLYKGLRLQRLGPESNRMLVISRSLKNTLNRLTQVEARLAATENSLSRVNMNLIHANNSKMQLEERLKSIYSSLSWRLTIPVRLGIAIFKRDKAYLRQQVLPEVIDIIQRNSFLKAVALGLLHLTPGFKRELESIYSARQQAEVSPTANHLPVTPGGGGSRTDTFMESPRVQLIYDQLQKACALKRKGAQ